MDPAVGNELVLPVLPVKNAVLCPQLQLARTIHSVLSVEAVNAAQATEGKMLVVATQRDPSMDEPRLLQDLYPIATLAVIQRYTKAEHSIELLLQGERRVRFLALEQARPFLKARVEFLDDPQDAGPEQDALLRTVLEQARAAADLIPAPQRSALAGLLEAERVPLGLVYGISHLLALGLTQQQALLESPTRLDALRKLQAYLAYELQVLRIRQKITQQAAAAVSKAQLEQMLRQELLAIQEQLGESRSDQAAVEQIRKHLANADLPEEVRQEAEREISRLERLPPSVPEYPLARSYVELLLDLPWRKATVEAIDLVRAREILNQDFYGLDEVKERILENVAVLKLNPKAHAPILCFVGPPVVGKTSLGQSIARAIGRKFERLSLGGLHDEAELRGHHRNVLGAMPGRILQAVRRTGVRNPLLMLDEVDKLGRETRGDPAAALLEILDPAQHAAFHDRFLDLPFDLSGIFFITTANSLEAIPRPLLERMQVLNLSGYSLEEKAEIARRYLIPKQLDESGLQPGQLDIEGTALARIISHYTREAGVRELERALGALARKVARRVAEGHAGSVLVQTGQLADLLGPERYFPERTRQQLPPGVAAGLAWTEVGGEVLYVEAACLPRSRRLRLTGSLGQVMRESAKAAQSYLWSHAEALGLELEAFRNSGVHIHVPSGAVPKDGPSAGVALAAALASAYSLQPLPRDLAMTGEITLTGLVLPVGAIKEKMLAAHRAGIRRVILPKENEKNLIELPQRVREEMEFLFAERIEEVLQVALPALRRRA